jgi:LPXTG-site transpeptidase (sortase) family protein
MMPRWRRSATSRQAATPASAGDSPRGGANTRQIRRLGDILLIAGGLILAYPFWSAGYAQVQQTRLDAAYRDSSSRFAEISAGTGDAGPKGIPDSVIVRRLAMAYGKELKKGDAIGRLKIPRISLDRLIQQGMSGPASIDPDSDRALLRSGPVHYAVTPLPGAGEPFAIAGHRTTYGAPFADLDKLRAGDKILIDTPYAQFRYTVVKKTVVRPTDVSVLLDRGYALVLTTCTPPYSASHRLIIWSSLESATPRVESSSLRR